MRVYEDELSDEDIIPDEFMREIAARLPTYRKLNYMLL